MGSGTGGATGEGAMPVRLGTEHMPSGQDLSGLESIELPKKHMGVGSGEPVIQLRSQQPIRFG